MMEAPSPMDREYLRMAIEESRKCVPSMSAYSVGAVVVTVSGKVYTGYSRETSPDNHAEEEAIAKAKEAGTPLEGAVMYSSMEPCTNRRSKPVSCTALIIREKFSKVVYALEEPPNLAVCYGCRQLTDAGIKVICVAEMAEKVMEINFHFMK